VDEKNDQIAHHTIVAGRRNPKELWPKQQFASHRKLARNWTADEQFAIDLAAELNRIAATHEGDETDLVDLTSELGVYDPPLRVVRFRD
jgi:hypothetical protein